MQEAQWQIREGKELKSDAGALIETLMVWSIRAVLWPGTHLTNFDAATKASAFGGG